MKKKNRKIVGYIGIFLFIAVIGFVFYFSTQQSYFIIKQQSDGYNVKPIDTGTFQFQGMNGTYETLYLGSLKSHGGDNTVVINDNNDGDIILFNTYEINNGILKLNSRIWTFDTSTPGSNFIEIKLNAKPGNYSVNYYYYARSYYGDGTGVSFNIYDISKSFGTQHFLVSQRGGSIEGSDVYTFELTKEKEITFRVDTHVQSKQEEVDGSMDITYIPQILPIEPPIEEKECSLIKSCQEGFECKDNKCVEIIIIPEENQTEEPPVIIPPVQPPVTNVNKTFLIVGISIIILLLIAIILKSKKRNKKRR